MQSEIRKSINYILFERVTSPLYGTLIMSWLIWNWKIIYLTLFVESKEIDGTKIDFILNNYSELNHILTYPLISTLILITIFPFISNGAFWVNLKFKKWKIDQKNSIEEKQLLTLEQSISIRKELREKENDFQEMISNKDLEITLLKKELETQNDSENTKEKSPNLNEIDSLDYSNFKQNEYVFKHFYKIAQQIVKSYNIPSNIPEDVLEYYLLNDIIEKSAGKYYLKSKGNKFHKKYVNENINK
jgi:hypothetical protein